MDELVGLFDNYSGDLHVNKPASRIDKYYFSGTIIIFLCLKGEAKFNVRFKEYTLQENCFLAIGAGIPFYYTDKSEDFRTDIFTIKESVFDKIAQGLIKIYFYRILYNKPMQKISHEKMMMCHSIYTYLKSFVSENDNYFKKQIIRNYLNILFYEACNIMLHDPGKNRNPKNKHKDEIAGNFIMLLEKNFKTSRKVEFYAREMHLTPKYLSATVKESTGRTASAWIDDYTVIEAKNMLRSGTATIQEIGYDLGFATPSHFAKFFKDKTGMTPKEARTKLLNIT